MNYRPSPSELELWDTWMFAEPDRQRMHLFFLANQPGKCWVWAGHAISSDLIHWETLPPVPLVRADDTVDIGQAMGTGMVFAAPNGEYMMSFTTNLGGPAQRIAFLHSRDLIHWDKRWHEPRIEAQGPYYETDDTQSVSRPPAFRDAFVHRIGDHYEALISAYATTGPALTRGCIARYKSTDADLRHWQPMPPLLGPGITSMMEVPEHFQLGDKHYLLWSNVFWIAGSTDTPSRPKCSGTFYAVADAYEGPYTVPADNLLIGSSLSSQAYVTRAIQWNGEPLFYHHLWSPNTSLGLPKRIVQHADGTIHAGYWPGIEAMHTQPISLPLDRIQDQADHLCAGQWTVVGENSVTGSIDAGATLARIPVDLQDVHLRCDVTIDSPARFGIALRDPGLPKYRREGVSHAIKGVAIQGDLRYKQWQIGAPEYFWTPRIDPDETLMQAPTPGRTYRMDLIVRDIYFEVYIDGLWTFTRLIHDRARTGGIGLFVEGGSARFENIHAWALEPMMHPYPADWPA